jgi:hypothetical protein
MAEYLAYQDRIVGATLESVRTIPTDGVTTFLTQSMLSEDPELSYRSITKGLPPVAPRTDPLGAGPEIFVCPSGGVYRIQLYRIAGDPDTEENPAPLYPGVTCSIHGGVAGGGLKESRDLLDTSTERAESGKWLADVLDRAGLFGTAFVSVGLALLILYLVRHRRS